MVDFKKLLEFALLFIRAIVIIGAISTEDIVFVIAGVISILPLIKELKDFISTNSGGNV